MESSSAANSGARAGRGLHGRGGAPAPAGRGPLLGAAGRAVGRRGWGLRGWGLRDGGSGTASCRAAGSGHECPFQLQYGQRGKRQVICRAG